MTPAQWAIRAWQASGDERARVQWLANECAKLEDELLRTRWEINRSRQCSQLEAENQALCQKIDVLEQGLTESKAMIDTLKNGLVQALEEL